MQVVCGRLDDRRNLIRREDAQIEPVEQLQQARRDRRGHSVRVAAVFGRQKIADLLPAQRLLVSLVGRRVVEQRRFERDEPSHEALCGDFPLGFHRGHGARRIFWRKPPSMSPRLTQRARQTRCRMTPSRGTYHWPQVLVTYRITVPLPVKVYFPSIRYVVRQKHFPWPPWFALEIEEAASGRTREVIEHYRGPTQAMRVFFTGVEVRRPSVADTVFQRMVRDGAAEVLEWPHCECAFVSGDVDQLNHDRWLARRREIYGEEAVKIESADASYSYHADRYGPDLERRSG